MTAVVGRKLIDRYADPILCIQHASSTRLHMSQGGRAEYRARMQQHLVTSHVEARDDQNPSQVSAPQAIRLDEFAVDGADTLVRGISLPELAA